MQFDIKTCVRCLILLVLSLTSHASASSDENLQVIRLSNHIPVEAISNSALLGRADSFKPTSVTFVLPLRHQDDLELLLTRLYDPNDELFGKYLTPEEFNERFAPTEEDYNTVIDYAKGEGLEIVGTYSNRTMLKVSAQTHLIEKAFSVRLDQYQLPNGRQFHAPSNNPEIPASIASIISGIVGLDNHAEWRPFHVQRIVTEGNKLDLKNQLFPSGPNGGFTPSDLRTAYNLNSVPSKGAGQVIAQFQLGKFNQSDIDAYCKQFGLPPAKIKIIKSGEGAAPGANGEVTLDIELAHAIAPDSEIYIYESSNSLQDILNAYNKIVTDNIAKQVTSSWGLGEDFKSVTLQLQAENAIFQQMAAHGQSMFAAAGDSGAYEGYGMGSDKLIVADPAAQPYVTAVGGTNLTVNQQDGSYVNEVVWNDGQGAAGGGGVSTVWPIPSWQNNVSTVYSKTNRNVPDVSLHAGSTTGYAIYYQGQWTAFGGTSCAAPLWAGFIACVNQGLAANNKPALGFANPTLYTIGNSSSHATNFFDVVTGDNLFYKAGPGYDNATGWGSFNGANLYATLTNSSIPLPPVIPPVPQPPEPPIPPVIPPVQPPVQAAPSLNITLLSSPNIFSRGREGVYTIDIFNKGDAPTSGPITVQLYLPQGFSVKSVKGLGWTLNQSTLTFTQNFPIKAGFYYPSITVVASVGYAAPSTVTATATISGGGSASSTAFSQTPVR